MGYLTNAIKALFTRNTTNAASVSGARIPIVEQNGNPIGNDSMSNLAAVLGVGVGDKHWHYMGRMTGSTPLEINLSNIGSQHGFDAQGLWIFGYGGSSVDPGRQSLYFCNSENNTWERISPPSMSEDAVILSKTFNKAVLSLTFNNEWMYIGLRKL